MFEQNKTLFDTVRLIDVTDKFFRRLTRKSTALLAWVTENNLGTYLV